MLFERDSEIETLNRAVGDLDSLGGRVILVRGEPGIGKTALIGQFISDIGDRAHVLLGTCDDLLTPQPLGPIWDIARQETSVARSLSDGDRRAVMEVLLDLLSRALRPTLLVLEDTQWAGEATLDIIKFLARRIARTNGLLILTYRDSEVDASHPLRQVIGTLPPRSLIRMRLNRLSTEATAAIIGDRPFDLATVHSLTNGNPLFVTEVVSSGIEAAPTSVQDSVLARALKVSEGARQILDLVSVVPGEADMSLISEILDVADSQLDECVRQGLLRVHYDTVAFPHELQRRALESSLSSTDRRRLNALVLEKISANADPSLLAHHAREAGDIQSIIAHAPKAARAASASKSTRESVAHFRVLEPYLGQMPISEQADILGDWALEEYYLDDASSLRLVDRAIEIRRSVGEDQALARTLTFAARIMRSHLKNADALAYVADAVRILEPYGATGDLAQALSIRALINWLSYEDIPMALLLAKQATAVAVESADEIATLIALEIEGAIMYSGGDQRGMSLVEEGLRLAQRGRYAHEEVRALLNLASMSGDDRNIGRAMDFIRRAHDTAIRNEMPALEANARSMHSEYLLWTGAWLEAENAASESVDSSAESATLSWRVLATLQTRRGRSTARSALTRMWSLAQTAQQLTVMDPAAAVLAEHMWLTDQDDTKWKSDLRTVLAMGLQAGKPWPSGAFAFWMWKLGLLDAVPEGTADFYGWIISGDYDKSAQFWRKRAIPYEEGLALMHGSENERIEAVRIFEQLGATATATKVRRILQKQGVAVSRGTSRSTRDHVAGLTGRQAEVLQLLAESLTNAEIADRLFVSHRTVENHVSAILMKLDVPTRGAAVDTARKLGILARH